jgi:DNA gyrase/topoisomerase IV subunit B
MLAFIARLSPTLFEQERIRLVHTPLFKGSVGSNAYFGDTVAEVEAAMDAAGESKNRSIQRFKGLGEVSAEDLADIVFSKSAKFEIVTLADGNLEQFAELAENGDENVATRRELIDAAIQMGDF